MCRFHDFYFPPSDTTGRSAPCSQLTQQEKAYRDTSHKTANYGYVDDLTGFERLLETQIVLCSLRSKLLRHLSRVARNASRRRQTPSSSRRPSATAQQLFSLLHKLAKQRSHFFKGRLWWSDRVRTVERPRTILLERKKGSHQEKQRQRNYHKQHHLESLGK